MLVDQTYLKIPSMNNRDLASMLFDSLRNKIMTLSDDVIIYQDMVKFMWKDLSSETIGTLGDQKRTNYALRENMTRWMNLLESFRWIIRSSKYFPDNTALNKKVMIKSDEIINRSFNNLTLRKLIIFSRKN